MTVDFRSAAPEAASPIDLAYHNKYDRFGPSPVSHVTGPEAQPFTISLAKAEQ